MADVSCSFLKSDLENVAKKYHKEIADKIKIALEDEVKMQDLAEELQERGYSKSVDTIKRFRFSL